MKSRKRLESKPKSRNRKSQRKQPCLLWSLLGLSCPSTNFARVKVADVLCSHPRPMFTEVQPPGSIVTNSTLSHIGAQIQGWGCPRVSPLGWAAFRKYISIRA